MLVVALLLAALLAAWLLDRAGAPGLRSWAARMRLALAVALVCIGIDHLRTPERYLPMMPAALPAPRAIVLITGWCEIAGALGLLVPRTRRLSGICLAAYFVAVLPANVKVALDGTSVAGLPTDRAYYVLRLLLQPVLVWWALVASEVVRRHAR